ncbi:MAG: hypothetical protein QNK37_35690 [Acidobacteriota bacterium]|nr:hypothetical protein [Acidobacteriota bacterium]
MEKLKNTNLSLEKLKNTNLSLEILNFWKMQISELFEDRRKRYVLQEQMIHRACLLAAGVVAAAVAGKITSVKDPEPRVYALIFLAYSIVNIAFLQNWLVNMNFSHGCTVKITLLKFKIADKILDGNVKDLSFKLGGYGWFHALPIYFFAALGAIGIVIVFRDSILEQWIFLAVSLGLLLLIFLLGVYQYIKHNAYEEEYKNAEKGIASDCKTTWTWFRKSAKTKRTS